MYRKTYNFDCNNHKTDSANFASGKYIFAL